jgi:hypothetical protein
MLTRIVCCVLGYSVLAVPAIRAESTAGEDATKTEAHCLRVQAQALLAQARALEARAQQARSEREAADKYMRALAESCLEALAKGDHEAILPVMTEELKATFYVDKGNLQARQNLDLLRRRGISVTSCKITSTTIAPTHEEALFRVEVTGTSTITGEQGKDRRATIVLRIQKEKGRFALGFLSIVILK